MARYLIDTDVMIDVSRRNAAAATYVDSLDEIAISIITAHELIVGARNQRDAEGIDGLVKTYPLHADLNARITGRAYPCLWSLAPLTCTCAETRQSFSRYFSSLRFIPT